MAQEMYEEKTSYSGFERFLFIITPIVFTVILLGVLLTLFNVDWRNNILNWAEDIPVINKLLPESDKKESAGEADSKKDEDKDSSPSDPSAEEQIADLKELLASKDKDLRVLADKRQALESEVKDLKKQVNEFKQQNENSDKDSYTKQIKELASMYGKMMPSKAAPIMENWAPEEVSLIMSEMKEEQRVKILEKMNPKVAADVSMILKDSKSSENQQIAALQARLKKQQVQEKSHTGLDKTELSKTFASMTPQSGAEVLLETAKVSPTKALAVLNTVDNNVRSKLLDAMTKIDKEATAKLVAKLLPNQ
ncbi:MotE family protein [Paenibacillus assamensis]|uniref:MotE family protein n=1 Tax=Paenibacillus assamensis TaxID=311244 RepID=UPI00040A378D|nr:primosomal protein [Paenibacillus assamensis]